jgi:hypothetical protein
VSLLFKYSNTQNCWTMFHGTIWVLQEAGIAVCEVRFILHWSVHILSKRSLFSPVGIHCCKAGDTAETRNYFYFYLIIYTIFKYSKYVMYQLCEQVVRDWVRLNAILMQSGIITYQHEIHPPNFLGWPRNIKCCPYLLNSFLT